MEEPRPEFVTDAHLRFLDELRESGQTNMFGAAPYIADLFEIPMQQARKILIYWMRTFGTRKDKGGTMGQVKQAKFNLADAVNQAADRIMSLREDAQASRAQVIAAIYKYLGAEFEKDITDPVAFCQLADAVIEFVNPK